MALSRPTVAIGAVAAACGAVYVLLRRRSSTVNVLNLLTPVPEDIVIAQSVVLTPIRKLFRRAFGLSDEELFPHGLYKGKLSLGVYDRLKHRKDGSYIVVCGINPTPHTTM